MSLKATSAVPVSVFVPFAKVQDLEDGTVYVEGVASQEMVDSHGEVVLYEAAKAAFEEWTEGMAKATDGLSLGNIREMHQPLAAGKAVLWRTDEAAKAQVLGAVIVDKAAGEKAKARVYTGFSIGGDQVRRGKIETGSGEVPAIESFRLTEVSLVDRPACPAAIFSVVKRAEMEKAEGEAQPLEIEPKEATVVVVEEEEPVKEEAPMVDPGDPPTPPVPGPVPPIPPEEERAPELAEGEQVLGDPVKFGEAGHPLGWFVGKSFQDPNMRFVRWAEGKPLRKGAPEAAAACQAAVQSLKAALAEVAALPGDPEMWTLGDTMEALRFAISASYGVKMREAMDQAQAAAKAEMVETIKATITTTLTETLGDTLQKMTQADPSSLKATEKSAEAAEVLAKLEQIGSEIGKAVEMLGRLPAGAPGTPRLARKSLGGPEAMADKAEPSFEQVLDSLKLSDGARAEVHLKLAAKAVPGR